MTDRGGLSGGPSEHPDAAGHRAADPAEAGQPPEAAGASPAVAAAEGSQPSLEPRKPRKLLYVTLPGCWGALIFACLSFTPSLLPRGGIVQGLVCGITAAIGYGLGVLAAWVWRAFADRDPRRPRRWAWLTFFISAAGLYVVSFGRNGEQDLDPHGQQEATTGLRSLPANLAGSARLRPRSAALGCRSPATDARRFRPRSRPSSPPAQAGPLPTSCTAWPGCCLWYTFTWTSYAATAAAIEYGPRIC